MIENIKIILKNSKNKQGKKGTEFKIMQIIYTTEF